MRVCERVGAWMKWCCHSDSAKDVVQKDFTSFHNAHEQSYSTHPYIMCIHASMPVHTQCVCSSTGDVVVYGASGEIDGSCGRGGAWVGMIDRRATVMRCGMSIDSSRPFRQEIPLTYPLDHTIPHTHTHTHTHTHHHHHHHSVHIPDRRSTMYW